MWGPCRVQVIILQRGLQGERHLWAASAGTFVPHEPHPRGSFQGSWVSKVRGYNSIGHDHRGP